MLKLRLCVDIKEATSIFLNTGVKLKEKTISFKLTVGGMYFHQQQLYHDVIGDDIHVADINGKITVTIPTEHSGK